MNLIGLAGLMTLGICLENDEDEYIVDENSNDGKRVYGVGDDLHVAFITFLSFIEIDN